MNKYYKVTTTYQDKVEIFETNFEVSKKSAKTNERCRATDFRIQISIAEFNLLFSETKTGAIQKFIEKQQSDINELSEKINKKLLIIRKAQLLGDL